MWSSFGWGTLAASSLVIGAVLAMVLRINIRTIGLIMGFGAGVMISAVAFDLVEEAAGLSKGGGGLVLGMVVGCLVYDYDQVQVFGEWSLPVAGRPLALYADVYQNQAAENGLDTAWSTGVSYGKASDPRTWEVAYFYQLIEKDALFGQFIDHDIDLNMDQTANPDGSVRLTYWDSWYCGVGEACRDRKSTRLNSSHT